MRTKPQARDWWLKARIGHENDRRRKITEEDKEYMRKLHKAGEPIREIARVFEGLCSRRSVQLVLFPERYERIKARAKEVKRWEPYNDAEHRREYMRTYRAHIREVHLLEGGRSINKNNKK
jgi:hypothetical protein